MDFLSAYNDQVNSILEPLTQPPVSSALTLFLVMYGGLAAPKLPPAAKNMFTKMWFRVLVLFIILWTGSRDPGIAIAVAVAFIAIINVAGKRSAFETFEGVDGPQSMILPQCMQLKLYDLLESFNNDKKSPIDSMIAARVPQNLTVNDSTAPLIGTYLVNRGFVIKNCNLPGATERSAQAWI